MKTILSGIQPSGSLTLGNYLGAIKNFVALQNSSDEKEIFVFIADLHAITVYQEPAKLRQNILSLAAIYLASGLDKDKTHLFIQSEVQGHVELGYLLQTITYIGELERMTQYKDKKVKQVDGVSSALLTYPVLMAADILLYNTDVVPVGVDQKQHLELARNLAIRFNSKYSDTFKVPEPLIQKTGAKIMSLQDPTKKMSKSDKLEKASIFILDDEATIRKKIASAVTDCDGIVNYDPVNKPGVSNLISILAACKDITIEEASKMVMNMNYGTLKNTVSDAVCELLLPIQKRYYEIINNKEYLNSVLDEGAEAAYFAARKMISKVKRKMGLQRSK